MINLVWKDLNTRQTPAMDRGLSAFDHPGLTGVEVQ
jgi:hypothetical protein